MVQDILQGFVEWGQTLLNKILGWENEALLWDYRGLVFLE